MEDTRGKDSFTGAEDIGASYSSSKARLIRALQYALQHQKIVPSKTARRNTRVNKDVDAFPYN